MIVADIPKNCVIAEVFGGLGNQMFQYAAGRSMALKHDVELYLSRYHVKQDKLRQYQLHVFNIQATEMTREQEEHCRAIVGERNKGKRAWRKAMRHVLPGRFLTHFEDPHKAWRPEFMELRPACYLEGYWQDERYFADIRPTLLQDFSFAQPQTGLNHDMAIQISGCNAISLHVRRGDYLKPEVARVFAVCTQAYYLKAIDYINTRCENPVFFVFSDDIPWVRQNLQLGENVVYVDHNDGQTAHEDMRLMSLCKHNITANSTFSWWGAWLNANPDKIVCCPDHWVVDPARNQAQRDAQPKDWVRL